MEHSIFYVYCRWYGIELDSLLFNSRKVKRTEPLKLFIKSIFELLMLEKEHNLLEMILFQENDIVQDFDEESDFSLTPRNDGLNEGNRMR